MRFMRAVWLGLALTMVAVSPLITALPAWADKSETKSTPAPKSAKFKKNGKTAQPKLATPIPVPIPATWSIEEIAEERQLCRQMLAAIDAVALPEASFRKGKCGAAAPIRLVSVGKSPQVVLSPPAIMTCRLAAAIHRWSTQDLQKLAKKHLNDQIIRIEVMSDYSCRNAYGRKSGRLSEHALANALDIRGFSTAGGKVVRVLSSWGPTARDIAAEKAKAKRAAGAKLKADQDAAAIQAELKQRREAKSSSAKQSTAKKIIKRGTEDVLIAGKQLATAAKKVLAKGLQKQTPMLPLSKRITRRGYFLRSAHKSACKIFGTTLGPEANNAHRNHFHIDMSPRRRQNFCE